jgi:hypothetical protein
MKTIYDAYPPMDLLTDALIDTVVLPTAHPRSATVTTRGIPTSTSITGLEVRLSRVLVIDNRTPKILFLPGRANVYLLLLVVDNLGGEPKTFTLNGFADIDDNEDLPVDKTAYYWAPSASQPVAPSQIHVLLSVIKSKEGLRNVGQVLDTAKTSSVYQQGLAQLLSAVVAAPAQVANLVLQLGEIVGGFLTHVEDKPLFTQVVSFTDINGDFDILGKTVYSRKNACIRTELTLVVRDQAREQTLLAGL